MASDIHALLSIPVKYVGAVFGALHNADLSPQTVKKAFSYMPTQPVWSINPQLTDIALDVRID